MPLRSPNALVVVAKQPAAGHTKTRLSPPLSQVQASVLYEGFLRDTLEQMRGVDNAERIIAYASLSAEEYFRHLAPDFELIPQQGRDLGERLDAAMTRCLSGGYRSVVIMDSDSPTLPPKYLVQAFELLSDGAEVVLGPCDDGGYYLIGARQPVPRLLREVRMSTPSVAADTIALASAEGLHLEQLPAWYDVDDAASLARLAREIDVSDANTAVHTRQFLHEVWIRQLLRTAG